MRNILVILFAVFLHLPLLGQGVVSGIVTSKSDSQPIRGVVVKVEYGGKTESYAITDIQGKYELKYGKIDNETNLTFDHLAYKKLIYPFANKIDKIDVALEEKSIEIKEVVISAPKLRLRGDTLSYVLSAFTSKADVSLEDAIRNLPGINVTTNGAIQYQGKDISKFYIEGLDLLGGRYGIATKNLQAKSVSSVEVLENHQDIVQLKDKIYSDNIAINIKLTSQAKLRPQWTAEVLGGYAAQGGLYRIGVTGMIFGTSSQTIATAKSSNVGAVASHEIMSHQREDKELVSNAISVSGNLNPSSVQLPESRYRNIEDQMVSVNNITKMGSSGIIKSNIDYSRNRNHYQYSNTSSYYTPEGQIEITELQQPLNTVHKPLLAIEYSINDSTVYLANRLRARGRVEQNNLNLTREAEHIIQQRQAGVWALNNDFVLRRLSGENLWSISSSTEYNSTPRNILRFDGIKGVDGDFYQTVTGTSFVNKEDFSLALRVGHYSRINLPASVAFSYDGINTELHKNSTTFSNNVGGYRFTPSIAPQYEYSAPDNRITLRLALPVNLYAIGYRNYLHSTKVHFNPNMYLNYILSSSFKLNVGAGITNSVGDILDLLNEPVQINYRTQNIKSGIVAQSRNEFANLRIEFKKPAQYLFINAYTAFSNNKRNLLPIQQISRDEIINSNIPSDNTSSTFNSLLSVTKLFQSINTKITVGGGYNFSRGDIIRQDIITKFEQSTVLLNGQIIARPVKWIELDYNTVLSTNSSQFTNVRQSLTTQNHSGKLSIFPTDVLSIWCKMDYSKHEIQPSLFKEMALGDIGAAYQLKKIRLEFTVNNVFDSREYAYTIFSGLDNFTYSYRLRGREYMFSLSFSIN